MWCLVFTRGCSAGVEHQIVWESTDKVVIHLGKYFNSHAGPHYWWETGPRKSGKYIRNIQKIQINPISKYLHTFLISHKIHLRRYALRFTYLLYSSLQVPMTWCETKYWKVYVIISWAPTISFAIHIYEISTNIGELYIVTFISRKHVADQRYERVVRSYVTAGIRWGDGPCVDPGTGHPDILSPVPRLSRWHRVTH